jgi:quercetin dioxygenase-like cupin family protein
MPFQTQLIDPSSEPLFSILGPVVQFLVDPAKASGAFGLIRGTVAPGIEVPVHSHADAEIIYVLDGILDVLQVNGNSSRWLTAKPGEIVCIPGDAKHALRNSSREPVVLLLASTPEIYGFFLELAKPFDPNQPAAPEDPEEMERLAALSAKYNYWIASPQENAAIGLTTRASAGAGD